MKVFSATLPLVYTRYGVLGRRRPNFLKMGPREENSDMAGLFVIV